jgi:putative nucleotidyltransferase with HDIG domain
MAEEARRVLIVDDEETLRTALARYMRSLNFEVHTAGTGDAALEQMRRMRFALAVCDVRMPGMTGVDVVPQALAIDPDIAIIMLTAVNDAPTATEALARGAMDYLLKPIELADLGQAVERALRKRDLGVEQRRIERMIREEVAARTAELEHERQALRSLTVSIAETLINAMEAKDVYLRGHSQRVADLGASIAQEMGLDADTVEHVRLAGRLHDIGKIGIREAVLNKPGPLTGEEYAHVQEHVRIGMEILAPLKHIETELRFVADHHEHVDGRGYPQGLSGAEISLGGRILVAADTFDALTSRRAYRDARAPAEAIEFMAGLVDTLLDASVYESLRTVVDRRQTLVFIDDLHG